MNVKTQNNIAVVCIVKIIVAYIQCIQNINFIIYF